MDDLKELMRRLNESEATILRMNQELDIQGRTRTYCQRSRQSTQFPNRQEKSVLSRAILPRRAVPATITRYLLAFVLSLRARSIRSQIPAEIILRSSRDIAGR